MNTLILKIHGSNATIDSKHLTLGNTHTLRAKNHVNYELIDAHSQRAPNHILTKRSGKDLHLYVRRDAIEPDLILEGFYDSPDSRLIGLAEDGQYYHYIPDTGEVSDYFTQLSHDSIEGHALGAQPTSTPWWVSAGGESGSVLGRIVGMVGLAGATTAIVIKNDDDHKNTHEHLTSPTPIPLPPNPAPPTPQPPVPPAPPTPPTTNQPSPNRHHLICQHPT